MPALQLEARELCHQVKFGWPDVAVWTPEELRLLAAVEMEMVRYDTLLQDVVGVQPDVTRLGMPDRGLLSRREFAQLRHPQLDDKAAAEREVTRRVLKASDLFGLGQQVRDRVEDEVNQCVLPRCAGRGHVSNDHRNPLLVGLATQLVDHRSGELDAGNWYAVLGQRDSDPTGSDRELERSAVASKFGKPIDRRSQHLGGEHASTRGVVALGSFDIPNLLLAHADDPGNGFLTTSNGMLGSHECSRQRDRHTAPRVVSNSMEENKARRVVDALRDRGTDAELARVGVYQFGVSVKLSDGREATWDSDGTAALEAQVMRNGVLVGYVPAIEGSDGYSEEQIIDAILRTDYDRPIATRLPTAPAPAPPLPRKGGLFRRFMDGFRYR